MDLTPNSNLPQDELYDLKLINQMCRGNQEQVVKIVNVFVEEITQSIEEIKAAFSEKDFSALKKLTHKIKPTLTYFGAPQAQQKLLLIDTLLLQNFEIKELEVELTKFISLSEEVIEKLKNDFNINK
ncbi:Hpt domain-containing protein [Lutibacter sp. HS1-25]|uniref:Hpt domain-containing protein n=1 Tax=Lutibacter sp. HS1-25 TaxID=2485000 RepID=UPI0010137276|nr:Hpt domain-containing protein [Lutibacter sp. HS1-25]RXP45146.1 Hpt domain-containing protein [Lutibacter sp. HS1-25]